MIKDAEPSDVKILQGLMEKEDFEHFKGARSLTDFNDKFVLGNFLAKQRKEEEVERQNNINEYIKQMI